MNFKLLILLFFVSSCGVKGDPASPKSERLPSLLENYPDINLQQPLQDSKRQTRRSKK